MSGVSALHRFQEFQVFHAIPQRDITKGSHLQTIRNIYYENNYVFFLSFSDFPLQGILLQAISGVYSPQVSVFCSGVGIYREIHVHQPFTTLLTGFFPPQLLRQSQAVRTLTMELTVSLDPRTTWPTDAGPGMATGLSQESRHNMKKCGEGQQ